MPALPPLLTKLSAWCFPQVLFSLPRTTGLCCHSPFVRGSLCLTRLGPPGGLDCLVSIPDHILWAHGECWTSEQMILTVEDFPLYLPSTPSQFPPCRWTPACGACVLGSPRYTLGGARPGEAGQGAAGLHDQLHQV